MAMTKLITIEIRREGPFFAAECPDLLGCVSQGRSLNEAIANIGQAMQAWAYAEMQKEKRR